MLSPKASLCGKMPLVGGFELCECRVRVPHEASWSTGEYKSTLALEQCLGGISLWVS